MTMKTLKNNSFPQLLADFLNKSSHFQEIFDLFVLCSEAIDNSGRKFLSFERHSQDGGKLKTEDSPSNQKTRALSETERQKGISQRFQNT